MFRFNVGRSGHRRISGEDGRGPEIYCGDETGQFVGMWARSSDPFILRSVVSVVRSSLLASLGDDSRFVSFYEEVQSKETAKLASARQHETQTEECPEPEKSTVSSRTT
jgi:hypothetical protein